MENEVRTKKLKPWDWILIVAAIIYTISPIDLIPDVIPIVGWLDDLAVLVATGYHIIKKIRSR